MSDMHTNPRELDMYQAACIAVPLPEPNFRLGLRSNPTPYWGEEAILAYGDARAEAAMREVAKLRAELAQLKGAAPGP